MFYWQAGRKATARKHFLFQRSRMQSILVECTAPAAVVYMTVAGTLTGLNKVDPATQLERTMKGLDPAIRPVNSGTNIIKQPMTGVVDSRSGARVKKNMSRFNVGVNTASGAEVISLSTRAAVAAGWMAPTEDVII